MMEIWNKFAAKDDFLIVKKMKKNPDKSSHYPEEDPNFVMKFKFTIPTNRSLTMDVVIYQDYLRDQRKTLPILEECSQRLLTCMCRELELILLSEDIKRPRKKRPKPSLKPTIFKTVILEIIKNHQAR